MTGISLHMQWPLTSQVIGESVLYSVCEKLRQCYWAEIGKKYSTFDSKVYVHMCEEEEEHFLLEFRSPALVLHLVVF
jgi:hypothetical protein